MFPQTAPTDDAFFNGNWAGACWNRWAGNGYAAGLVHRLWMWEWDFCASGCGTPLPLDVGLLCKKSKKEGGSAGVSPVVAPMSKSVHL